jgi:hypothetical protein
LVNSNINKWETKVWVVQGVAIPLEAAECLRKRRRELVSVDKKNRREDRRLHLLESVERRRRGVSKQAANFHR